MNSFKYYLHVDTVTAFLDHNYFKLFTFLQFNIDSLKVWVSCIENFKILQVWLTNK